MPRPIKAGQKEKEPIGYQSVTVRLPHKLIDALNKLDKGKRADFIRNAINEKLAKEGIDVAGGADSPPKAK